MLEWLVLTVEFSDGDFPVLAVLAVAFSDGDFPLLAVLGPEKL